MVASLVVVALIGGLLALVTNMSVAIAFRLPWRAPEMLPRGKVLPVLVEQRAPELRTPFVVFGFCLLSVASVLLAYASSALGALAEPVTAAIVAVAVIWCLGIVAAIVRAAHTIHFAEVLGPGDPDHDWAFAYAENWGIRPTAVYIVDEPVELRHSGRKGVICLTRHQRSELTVQERRIAITQQLAAVKYFESIYPMAFIRGSAMLLTGAVGGLIGQDVVFAVMPGLVATAIVDFVASHGVSHGLRKIDAFTFQAIGDYEAVERTIVKDFPMTLSSSIRKGMPDAALQRLLKRRINRLRAAALETRVTLAKPPRP